MANLTNSLYVHSHWSRFNVNYANIKSQNNDNEIDEFLNKLKKNAETLKAATDDFLGDISLDEFRHFVTGDAYTNIAFEVLRDPSFEKEAMKILSGETEILDQKILKGYTTDFENFLGKENYQEMTEELGNTFTSDELTKKLVGALLKDGKVNKKQLSESFIVDTINTNNISKWITEEMTNRPYFSKNGKLVHHVQNAVQNIMNSGSHKRANKNGDVLAQLFRKYYFEYLKRQGLEIDKTQQTNIMLNIIDPIEDQIKKEFNTIKATDQRQAAGLLGENMPAAIINGIDSFGIQVQVVGNKTEDELRADKQYLGTFYSRVSNKVKMLSTSKASNRFSYTDLLFKRNGRVARVQSKNYQSLWEPYLQNNDVKMILHALSGDMSIEELLGNNLINDNMVGIVDLDLLKYVLVNEIWFQTAGDYRLNTRGGSPDTNRRGNDYHGSSILSEVFAPAISNALGIVLDKAGNVIDLSSNLFWLINNTELVPTYVLVQKLAEGFETIRENLIHFSLTLKGKPNVGTAEAFYERKKEAVQPDRLSGKYNYESDALVQVGSDKGYQILETARIKALNLNLDFDAIIKSAYSI